MEPCMSEIKAEWMPRERYLVNRSICISHRWGRATGRWRRNLTVGSLLPRLLSDRGEQRVTATSSHLPQEKQPQSTGRKSVTSAEAWLRLRSKQHMARITTTLISHASCSYIYQFRNLLNKQSNLLVKLQYETALLYPNGFEKTM